MKAARKLRRLQHPRSLMEHLRQFLTPQVWKQARQAVPRGRSLPRWDLQPLVIIMLALTCGRRGQTDLEVFVEKLLNRSDPEARNRSDPEATDPEATNRSDTPAHSQTLPD